MLPANLTAAQFKMYPPQARKLATAHLSLIRSLPLAFLPSLLRELIDYDYKFPAERVELDQQFTFLESLSAGQRAELFSAFSQIRLSAAQQSIDWVNQPFQYTEQLSAFLWSTHQMDAFRDAAKLYGNRIHAAVVPQPLPIRRLGIAVIGQGASAQGVSLFKELRKHGTYFSKINPDNGLTQLLAASEARAQAHPIPYGHWYVDGAMPAAHSHRLTCISYEALKPLRNALLSKIQHEVSKPGMGPEELRDHLARLSPQELGLNNDPVLDRFQVRLLTEGSGTQIFSTTFAQWTAREALRRAEPVTLLVRFTPRQRQRPMSEMLTSNEGSFSLDPQGSLIDADMAAYYQWINQQRLPEAERAYFLVWFEGQSEAVAVGPTLPRGATSESSLCLKELLSSFS